MEIDYRSLVNSPKTNLGYEYDMIHDMDIYATSCLYKGKGATNKDIESDFNELERLIEMQD